MIVKLIFVLMFLMFIFMGAAVYSVWDYPNEAQKIHAKVYAPDCSFFIRGLNNFRVEKSSCGEVENTCVSLGGELEVHTNVFNGIYNATCYLQVQEKV